MTLQPTIFDGIKGSQELDLTLRKLKDDVLEGKNTKFSLSSDGILKFKERLHVPEDSELKELDGGSFDSILHLSRHHENVQRLKGSFLVARDEARCS